MICLFQIQTRCFRDHARPALSRIRRRCTAIGRLFCGTRKKMERFLTARRRAVEAEIQHEYRMG